MRAALVALWLIAAAIAPAQRLGDDAHELLARVVRIQSELRYSGKRVVEFRGLGERQRRVEIVARDGWLTRTEFAPGSPGEGQIIVENRRERRHFFPDVNEIHVSPPRQEPAIGRLREMLSAVRSGRWKLEIGEGDIVAGIRATRVEFTDPEGNVMQRLHIDKASGLVLRRELFDRVGGRVGFMEFQTVDLSPNLREDDFTINRRGAKIVTMDELLTRFARRLQMRPLRLSADSGYQLSGARVLPLGDVRGLEQTYIGPGGTLTIYQVRADIDPRRLQNRLGPRAAVRSWRTGDVTVAVVGEMPRHELERLVRLIGGERGS